MMNTANFFKSTRWEIWKPRKPHGQAILSTASRGDKVRGTFDIEQRVFPAHKASSYSKVYSLHTPPSLEKTDDDQASEYRSEFPVVNVHVNEPMENFANELNSLHGFGIIVAIRDKIMRAVQVLGNHSECGIGRIWKKNKERGMLILLMGVKKSATVIDQ
ncbi:hypothetical protein M422DRAFT_49177 [Sphaerobolus stellatus SS14]|uniref:Uncharacterized protein n=1 Tax=Sphaerobolus stellatus (strain SS14) TaxID=990650 RepID=A0A0C9V073_SPHS4|nr:hypothetical protein M422DRAFT_49177 [Sphaerobolus stellatus SS14]